MPGTLLAMFMTESVANTLIFVNFNSFVLLGQLVFMTLMLRRKDWWAGVPLGLTLAVKPVLGVLLLLPLLNRQWKVFAGAFAVPAVLTAAAWPVAVDPDAFVRRTVPYLLEVRDYYNSSLFGVWRLLRCRSLACPAAPDHFRWHGRIRSVVPLSALPDQQ